MCKGCSCDLVCELVLVCVHFGVLVSTLSLFIQGPNSSFGPENYELRTCSVRVFTVDLFCTWRAFLALLCECFPYSSSQGFIKSQFCSLWQKRLELELVSKPDNLSQDQYEKQGYWGLTVTNPEVTCSDYAVNMSQGLFEITDMQSFVEELLKVSLSEGFLVEIVTPAQILNCNSLRLVMG